MAKVSGKVSISSGSFNYQDATQARNASGIKTVVTNLQNDVKTLKNALYGDKYNSFMSELNRDWAGSDADSFIKDFKNVISKIDENLKKYQDNIQGVLESDNKQFQSWQAKY